MQQKNQPLIIQETDVISITPIQQTQTVVGIIQRPPNPNYVGNYNQNQGQPYYILNHINPYNQNPYNQNIYNPNVYNQNAYNIGNGNNNFYIPFNQNQPRPPPPPRYAPPPGTQPIPAQIINHPQINIIQQNLYQVCPSCGFNGSIPRQTAGCTVFSWCVCLFICTGLVCFWVPFCIDSCYDIQIVCMRCGYVKKIIQAGCM